MSNLRTARKHGNGAALMAMTVLACVWGYNWVAMKVGLEYAAPFDFVALRTMMGGGCLLLLLMVLRYPLKPPNCSACCGLVCFRLRYLRP